DKRKAIAMLLREPEWAGRSTNWISSTVRCSDHLVESERERLGLAKPDKIVGRDGVQRPASRAARRGRGRGRTPKAGLPAREEAPAAVEAKPEVGGPRDAKGRPVPAKLAPAFAAATRFRSIVQLIGRLKTEVAELRQLPGGECLTVAGIHIDLDNAQRQVRFAAPYVVCPDCNGAKCQNCNKKGWLREGAWEHLTQEQRSACVRAAA